MLSGSPIAWLPFWAIFAGTLLIVLLSVEGGFRWARHQRLASHETHREKESSVGAMVGTLLGLLALLLAFTFAKSADHYHERRVALFDEANAIRTLYTRTGLIDEPLRGEMRATLRDYLDDRLQWTGASASTPAASAALLDRLTEQASAAWQKSPTTVVANLIVGGTDQVVRLNAQRVEVNRTRVPAAVWAVLYLIAALSLGAMGYHCGVAGSTRSPVMLGVGIVFSLVIVLIVDLDRPGDGWIVVPQDSLLDVRSAVVPGAPHAH